MPQSTSVITPNLGLYLGRSKLGVPARALQEGLNFRVYKGKLSNLNMGWVRFGDFTLNGPVMKIDNVLHRDGTEHLLFVTTKDIYRYNVNSEVVTFLTPTYITGTAAASGVDVTGTTTTWDADDIKSGDFISFGANDEDDPAASWFEIDSVTNDTALVLAETAGTVVDGPYTIRRTFTGGMLDSWNSAIFYNAAGAADEWWATNGVDSIVRWQSTENIAEQMESTLGFKAKTLSVYANMMIYGNITQGGTEKPTDIINSNAGDPSDVSGGLSEQFKVHGNVGEIYNMTPIGDALAIYSRFNVTLAQFINGIDIFAFRQVISNQGAIGFKAVADFGDTHQFVGSDGLYSFDGVTVRDVGEHVWRDVIYGIKPNNRTMTFNMFNDVYGELIWVVPQNIDPTDSPTIAYTEHYLEETGTQDKKFPFSKREFPFTAIGNFTRQATLTWDLISTTWAETNFRWNDQFFSVAFPFILVGDENGKIYTLNGAQTQDGVDAVSYVTFGRKALWDGRMRGLLTRVYPFALPGTTTLDVTVQMADQGEQVALITDTQSFNATDSAAFFTAHYRRGRFFEVKFGSDAEPWEISGYDYDKRQGGLR